MPLWLIALFFAAGVAGWSYGALVRSNGNPVPAQNYRGALIAGAVTFILVLTFMKYILNF